MASQPKRVMRTAKRELNAKDFPRYVEEYLREKEAMEAMQARVNEKKAAINKFVDDLGEADEKGSKWVHVEGIPGLSAVKRERRVSQSLDTDKAEAWLKKNGLWEQYSEEIRVLDEDALYGAGYDGTIPRKVFDGFMVSSESFALKTVK